MAISHGTIQQEAIQSGQRPTANGQRPTANGQRPTANGQRPTAGGQRPTANGQRRGATVKRPVLRYLGGKWKIAPWVTHRAAQSTRPRTEVMWIKPPN